MGKLTYNQRQAILCRWANSCKTKEQILNLEKLKENHVLFRFDYGYVIKTPFGETIEKKKRELIPEQKPRIALPKINKCDLRRR